VRRGAPRQIGDDQVERAVRLTLEEARSGVTHKTKEIRKWFLRHPHHRLHFTPTHSSWLNQVERWFALSSRRQIKRGSHYSVRELEAAVSEFVAIHNQRAKPFIWTKTADTILSSIGGFTSRTLAVRMMQTVMQEINDSGD
jgi:DDE superfamily endonuclease